MTWAAVGWVGLGAMVGGLLAVVVVCAVVLGARSDRR